MRFAINLDTEQMGRSTCGNTCAATLKVQLRVTCPLDFFNYPVSQAIRALERHRKEQKEVEFQQLKRLNWEVLQANRRTVRRMNNEENK